MLLSLLALFLGTRSTLALTTLNGSGATFPAPLYLRWASEFGKSHPDILVNYQGIGSGAGIVNFTKGLTDFCASDVLLTSTEIEKNHGNLLMIPLSAGMIVLAYNLPNIKELKLSREAYSGIFLGTIVQWDDPRIMASNPGVPLPSLPITVITRSDGSGTTSLLTEHLATMSAEFENQVGSGRSVKWPVGIAGKGNDGVTSLIKGTSGAIGYVEYGFAKNNHLAMAELENKAGSMITASPQAGSEALLHSDFLHQENGFNPDPRGIHDYPITGFTWMILRKSYPAEKSKALKEFFSYALTQGQSLSTSLGYLPLPDPVEKKSLQSLEQIQSSSDK